MLFLLKGGEKMKFDAVLETRTGKKGNVYECLVIKLSPNVEKLVFLTTAELELLKLQKSQLGK